MEKIERQKPLEVSPKERIKSFGEVSKGFTKELAMIEAKRCLGCKNAPCIKGCPVSVNIPGFIKEIINGNIDGAIDKIKENSNLPSICGRVCPQELQCESKCLRGKIDKPVAIGLLERFVGDSALENSKQEKEFKSNGKKVAIVGSGPAGLACATDLAKEGVEVTIFEAFHKAGGVLVYGIPEFRLPKSLVQKEIDNLLKLGVKLELNTVIGKTITMEELLDEFDAVFIGSGAGLPVFLNIEGENLNGVYSANEYLTRVNLMGAYKENSKTPIMKGKEVVVVGAGNVAMDSARTARRMGANVKLVYRRTEAEMPARNEEIAHAKEEGIEFHLLTNPVKINGKDGYVNSMTCVKMMLGEKDKSGRQSPVQIENSEFKLDCDMVIVAVGTRPNPMLSASFSSLETAPKGTLVVNEEDLRTTVSRVYAGGDAVTGSATVIKAMGAGKLASKSILKLLQEKQENK